MIILHTTQLGTAMTSCSISYNFLISGAIFMYYFLSFQEDNFEIDSISENKEINTFIPFTLKNRSFNTLDVVFLILTVILIVLNGLLIFYTNTLDNYKKKITQTLCSLIPIVTLIFYSMNLIIHEKEHNLSVFFIITLILLVIFLIIWIFIKINFISNNKEDSSFNGIFKLLGFLILGGIILFAILALVGVLSVQLSNLVKGLLIALVALVFLALAAIFAKELLAILLGFFNLLKSLLGGIFGLIGNLFGKLGLGRDKGSV